MEERRMPLAEHLGELRKRIFRCAIVLIVGFFVAYAFHQELFRWFAQPVLAGLRRHGIFALQALQVTETITVYLQLSLVAGIVITAPYLIYQLWAFIAPGLYPRERRYVMPIAILTSIFFVIGIVFCYFVFLPMIVDFLVGFTLESNSISLVPTVERTYSLVLTFFIVFGLIFELPLIMFFLSLLGIVSHKKFIAWGRYFIVLAFIIGAIFTPPDPLSQVLMAVPLCLLYYIGVVFGYVAAMFRRKEGSHAMSWVFGGGVVILFAAGVGMASYAWSSSSTSPLAVPSLPAGTLFALKVFPSSPLAKQVASAAQAPSSLYDPDNLPDTTVMAFAKTAPVWMTIGKESSCDDSQKVKGGWCLIAGDQSSLCGNDCPQLRELDSEDTEVRLVLTPACAARVFLGNHIPPPDSTLVLSVSTASSGMATLSLRPVPDANGLGAPWLRTLMNAAANAPGRTDMTPLGRFLSLSEGDFSITDEESGPLATLTVSPARAARMTVALLDAASLACQSREDNAP